MESSKTLPLCKDLGGANVRAAANKFQNKPLLPFPVPLARHDGFDGTDAFDFAAADLILINADIYTLIQPTVNSIDRY